MVDQVEVVKTTADEETKEEQRGLLDQQIKDIFF